MNTKTTAFLILLLTGLFIVGCGGEEATPTAVPPTAIAVATATNPPPPDNGLASVDSVQIMTLESFPVQINVRARGDLANSCVSVGDIGSARTDNQFEVTIAAVYEDNGSCVDEIMPFDEMIGLDVLNLPAGTYAVSVNGMQTSFTLDADNMLPDNDPTPTNTPIPTATAAAVVEPTPEITATVAVTPTVAPAPEDCQNSIGFVEDLSVPDDTIFAPGAEVVKGWRLRNNGTCPWTTNYRLVAIGGDDIPGPISMTLETAVNPGETADFFVPFTAPEANGTYRENWQIANAKGIPFGIDGIDSEAFWVQFDVGTPPPTPEPDSAVIGGVVWRDYCSFNSDGTPTANCVEVIEGGGVFVGDGSLNGNERRIAGLTVSFSNGQCPADGEITAPVFATAVTDASGIYRREGLSPGTYCAWIDIFSAENVNLLIPGNWTWPGTGVGYWTVVLVNGEEALDIDFGWDDADD